MTDIHRKWLSVLAVCVFLLFCLFVTIFIGPRIVALAKQPELFRNWVDSFGVWGRLIFVTMVILQVIVALIPGEPLELAAGYAFGAVEGTILSLIGILIGSWIVFGAVRLFGRKLLDVFFADREIKRLAFLKDPKKARVMTFVLMTIPGTPKDLLSYFAGMTPLTMPQWLAIVAVSRIPSLVSSTVSGAAAGEKDYVLAGIVLAFTLILSGIGILYYRKVCRENDEISC